MFFSISQLSGYFEKLPGIGPRQARRFVYYLLNQDDDFLKRFAKSISELKKEVARCPDCRRFFGKKPGHNSCGICEEKTRNASELLIVEKDIDFENIEKTGFYKGKYFILGGLVPLVGKNMPEDIALKDLYKKIEKETKENTLKEIILAFSATLEGDNTSKYIEKILEPAASEKKIKISRLGRGLSTGTELEYSDKDTIESAFKNRR
jgi:recombination protein RecR